MCHWLTWWKLALSILWVSSQKFCCWEISVKRWSNVATWHNDELLKNYAAQKGVKRRQQQEGTESNKGTVRDRKKRVQLTLRERSTDRNLGAPSTAAVQTISYWNEEHEREGTGFFLNCAIATVAVIELCCDFLSLDNGNKNKDQRR